MPIRPGALVTLLLALLACTPARADSMRCGTRLVHDGDTRAEVIARCGEPTDVERRSIWRRPTYWHHGRAITLGTDFVEIPVELWLYNLGSSQLMRRLRFEDGRLVEIETLGYGFN